MAAAFIDGNFSIENYKKMKNIDADTNMREAFSQSTQEETTKKSIKKVKH